MQASQAKNEVRLPRAVIERSARLQASLDARQQPAEPEPKPLVETPAAETPPAPTPPAADPRESDPAYWKQRHKVTEGLLRVERDGRIADQQAHSQRISELNAQIHTLQAGIPAAPTDLSRFFTPEQIEKFGEEQCRTMATAAEAAADAKIQAAISTQVQPLVDARKQDQANAATAQKNAFQDALTEAYPTWREVDVSPGWHAWLAQPDESSGLIRQNILTSHGQHFDAARIAEMFRRYEDSNRPPAPPVAPHGTAGNGSGSAPPPSPVAAAGYPSQAEIKEHFKRCALNKVSESERAAFEARLKLRAA
jgi:hypothetical protein